MDIVTCKAPVNIAVIKYWGKRNEELILPLNDSISATLSMDHLSTTTTVMVSPNFKANRFWLNRVEQSLDNKRLQNILEAIRKLVSEENALMLKWNLHISSMNNFPTAAGLASSAAGYACLVTALASLYGVQTDLSRIARLGSGSACRSCYGGWVQWHAGTSDEGVDSVATDIETANHWPEMHILILVVNENKKPVPSTSGMQDSVQTSEFLKHRVSTIAPERIKRMRRAIRDRDFGEFAQLTMADSNQFHAVCLDTYPPCVYLNDISHDIMRMVHAYNSYYSRTKIAYTFDAGPNAILFLLERDVVEAINLINEYFPTTLHQVDYVRGIPINKSGSQKTVPKLDLRKQKENAIKYIIHTDIGDGPKIQRDPSKHLLDEDGLPRMSI